MIDDVEDNQASSPMSIARFSLSFSFIALYVLSTCLTIKPILHNLLLAGQNSGPKWEKEGKNEALCRKEKVK